MVLKALGFLFFSLGNPYLCGAPFVHRDIVMVDLNSSEGKMSCCSVQRHSRHLSASNVVSTVWGSYPYGCGDQVCTCTGGKKNNVRQSHGSEPRLLSYIQRDWSCTFKALEWSYEVAALPAVLSCHTRFNQVNVMLCTFLPFRHNTSHHVNTTWVDRAHSTQFRVVD